MRLIDVTIDRFKSVNDPTKFSVQDDITALVGKNESGKTAILQALYRLRPLTSGHPLDFEPLRDYPRRLYAREQDLIDQALPVAATFELTTSEAAQLAQEFGQGSLRKMQISISRGFGEGAGLQVDADVDELAVCKHLITREGLDASYVKSTIEETLAVLAAGESEAARALAEDITSRDLPAEIEAFLENLVPRFQYFDDYNVLPGSVSIQRLQDVAETELAAPERTALSLLRLARVDSEDFTQRDYESRRAALEAAANQLTDELFKYWSQNQDLSIELDIEFREVPGIQRLDPWLQIRVKNSRHRVTLNIDERSKGFIWFFSFLAAFSEYSEEDSRIILLDEPGTSLHARAQGDLLRFIEERLAPQHQVLYSTHSLFMVQANHLERCRTVEDISAAGTVVSQEVWLARPDTVFPLLGAIGVDISQTLFIGPNQLLVEGPSDFIYLTVVSEHLRLLGRECLDPRWTVTPVGGLDKLPAFIALMGGSDIDVTVLMDIAPRSGQRIAQLVERGVISSTNIVSIAEFVEATEADIEDLFAPTWYWALLTAAGLTDASELGDSPGRITKRVEAVIGKYNHYAPASYLLRSTDSLLDDLDTPTVDRFERLFMRLNALLKPNDPPANAR